MSSERLPEIFFTRDVLEVAPSLLGKYLVRKFDNAEIRRYRITETEAYKSPGDKACHASKGMTPRTSIMFGKGGYVYVYLIYGMYWMLNFVTGNQGDASAVLIRGIEDILGPGRVGKELQLDKSFYGEDLANSPRIWVEESYIKYKYTALPRVGIDYAGEPWVSKPWRYVIK